MKSKKITASIVIFFALCISTLGYFILLPRPVAVAQLMVTKVGK